MLTGSLYPPSLPMPLGTPLISPQWHPRTPITPIHLATLAPSNLSPCTSAPGSPISACPQAPQYPLFLPTPTVTLMPTYFFPFPLAPPVPPISPHALVHPRVRHIPPHPWAPWDLSLFPISMGTPMPPVSPHAHRHTATSPSPHIHGHPKTPHLPNPRAPCFTLLGMF